MYNSLTCNYKNKGHQHERQLSQQGLGISLTGGAALSVELYDVDKPLMLTTGLSLFSSILNAHSPTHDQLHLPHIGNVDHLAPTLCVGMTTSQLLMSSASEALLDLPSLPPAARTAMSCPPSNTSLSASANFVMWGVWSCSHRPMSVWLTIPVKPSSMGGMKNKVPTCGISTYAMRPIRVPSWTDTHC